MTFVALLVRSFTRHRALILGLAMLLSGFQVLLVLIARNLQRLGLFSQMAAMMPPFIQEALGGALVASFVGSVALGFFHPIVMLSLSCAAIYMASEPAGEVRTLADLGGFRRFRSDLQVDEIADDDVALLSIVHGRQRQRRVLGRKRHVGRRNWGTIDPGYRLVAGLSR